MTNNQKYVLYASNASVNATFLPYESSYSLNYNGNYEDMILNPSIFAWPYLRLRPSLPFARLGRRLRSAAARKAASPIGRRTTPSSRNRRIQPACSATSPGDRESAARGESGRRRRQRVVAPFRMGAYARPFPPAGLNAEPGAHRIEARWRMALSRRPSSIATQPSRP